jgi:hypothetical protein
VCATECFSMAAALAWSTSASAWGCTHLACGGSGVSASLHLDLLESPAVAYWPLRRGHCPYHCVWPGTPYCPEPPAHGLADFETRRCGHTLHTGMSLHLSSSAVLASSSGACANHIYNLYRYMWLLLAGIGFAKTVEGNLELIGCLPRLRQEGLQGAMGHLVMLAGASRKGFLGHLTGRTAAADRDAASLAAAVACVHGGADIVRVHNVGMTVDGVKVADAVWKGR